MPKTDRTNTMRFLESRKVPYTAHAFSPEIHSAEGVAQALGFPPSQVFKTLVTLSEAPYAKPVLAIIPGNAELDLKKLAKFLGEKKMRMATQREAETLTGLQVGGISALALLHKGFRTVIDASALSWERILISAGQRGLNLELNPRDLIPLISAQIGEIASFPSAS